MGTEEKLEVAVNDGNFGAEVLGSDLPVLVDFWAEWCGPCFMIAPAVEEIAREYQGRLKVCKLNVDQGSQTSSSYGVMNIPTLMIFKNGEMVDRLVGVVPKGDIISRIDVHI
ncbi:MAG: thioredoxin [Candidatus Makaraimicrobium thalassicum]|nr:MAG: thioredoxin [Candidatus Omnitrophota bacterium]